MQNIRKVLKELIRTWKNNEDVTIKGINSYGVEFETTGTIATTNNGEMALNDDMSLFLEFKEKMIEPKSGGFKGYYFRSECSQGIEPGLYIYSVEKNGKVIYENPYKREVQQNVIDFVEKRNTKLKEEGRDVFPESSVIDFLQKSVGRELLINGTRGVVIGLEGASESGYPSIAISRYGGAISHSLVTSSTKVSVEDEKGDEVLTVISNEEMFENDVKNIRNNIQNIGGRV